MTRRNVHTLRLLARLLWALVLSAPAIAAPPTAAPDREFERVAQAVYREAASQDLVDRLYDFMEKWPRDPRSDRVQFWVGTTQQRRKYHNEAIKELGYVISEFRDSPLVIHALRAQIVSYEAIAKPDKVAENFTRIYALKPKDFTSDTSATAAFRDAVLFLADQKIGQKQIDAAVGLYVELPDRTESITRTVHLYIAHDRHEDAIKLIRRLGSPDKMLAYNLTIQAYASRPGTANLYSLLNEVLTREPAGDVADGLVQQIAGAIGAKGGEEPDKVLHHVEAKYPRLKRWAQYGLCGLHRTQIPRLLTFIGDWRTGDDVEQAKLWIGEAHEAAGDAAKAREAYWRLADRVAAHFRVAETYYGARAKTRDLPAGENELTQIVKRFYSASTSCTAMSERAELQAGPMNRPDRAIATLRELVDRFPAEEAPASGALMRLGVLLRSIGKLDEAIAAYQKLIVNYASSPRVRHAWLAVASCYEDKSEPERAISVLKMVLRKYPRTPEASQAHTRLEVKYKIADTDVSDK